MNMRRAARIGAIGFFFAFSTLAGGCHIEYNGHDGDGAPVVGICSNLCDHLLGCDLIGSEDWQSCADTCNAQHGAKPYLVETGSQCVIDAGCKALDAYACSGAPLPSSSNSGGAGGACQANCDCPSGDQCVAGTCKTPCGASCECPTGDSCVAGYCEAPPEPEMTCQVDCDCPSGQICNAGICGAP